MNVSIRSLIHRDITTCLALCRENGWNQTRRDWERLIQLNPLGCFAATVDDRLVGTITTTTYEPRLGWIGMMLVDSKRRRQGIATRLLQQAIEDLQDRGFDCIKLDATPTGLFVYERLGFQVEWSYRRWQLEFNSGLPERCQRSDDAQRHRGANLADMSRGGSADWERALVLDKHAFGADRQRLLEMLRTDSAKYLCGLGGYAMLRRGTEGDYLGPVVCQSETEAERLIKTLRPSAAEKILWDVPAANPVAVELAERFGFAPNRSLTRMRLGPDCVTPDMALQYALAGPSVG